MRVGRGGMWVGGAWQEDNRVQKYVKSVIYFHPPVTRPIKGWDSSVHQQLLLV